VPEVLGPLLRRASALAPDVRDRIWAAVAAHDRAAMAGTEWAADLDRLAGTSNGAAATAAAAPATAAAPAAATATATAEAATPLAIPVFPAGQRFAGWQLAPAGDWSRIPLGCARADDRPDDRTLPPSADLPVASAAVPGPGASAAVPAAPAKRVRLL